MSQENVEVVERAVAALNERHIEGYLACFAQNVQVQPPWAAVEGVYEGPNAIRRFWADFEAVGPDLQISVERLEPVGPNHVLAFMHLTGSGRASQIPIDLLTANVYALADGEITALRIFGDRREALQAVGLRE